LGLAVALTVMLELHPTAPSPLVEPPAEGEADVEIVHVQLDAPAWFTVTVLPATVSVPLRQLVVELAATV